ncbi:MAG: hypothetical protein GTO40_09205, partial [Deltaproteobacteria bacterium]|nr:hypothetical protein [Deltaproteobacteria bacterium]
MSTTISPTVINDAITDYGVDMLNAVQLNEMTKTVEKAADTVAAAGSSGSSVYMGAPGDTKVVFVDG